MIELAKYFRILFLSVRISRDRLKDFTEDHIQRLTGNNPGGIFTAILTAVTTAYNNYFGDLASESLNIAVQKGKTQALKESTTNLLKLISDMEGVIAYTYREDEETYLEFFPQGLDEYHQATASLLETISGRLKTVLGNHSGDFAPVFISDYNTVQGLYVTNRAAQQLAMGDVAAERSDLATTRPALALQLTTNLLTIALQYVGDESKADVYFNQAILNAAFNESETRVEDEINPGETKNVFDNITKSTVDLMAKNQTTGVLAFGFVENINDPVANIQDVSLEAGEERGTTSGQAGWTTTKKYLNVTSYAETTGTFIVEKV